MKAYVFPGQGSQTVGMGKELFDEFPKVTEIADRVLGYSIKELCLEDKNNVLNQTQYTQPAMYVVNALYYYKKIKDAVQKPDYVAGHSLGEYNALLAAGAFDFETGLRLVKKRAELMQKAIGGGMAAIIGVTKDRVNEILVKNNLDRIDIANCNTELQTVISGYENDIDASKSIFEQVPGISYIKLKVSGAFHSRYMEDASEEFKNFIQEAKINNLEIPVISNVSGELYKNGEVKNNLINQIKSSVQWNKSMIYLMNQNSDIEIEQIGPGNALVGMTKRIRREYASHPEYALQAKQEAGENQIIGSKKATVSEKLGSDKFKKDYNLKYAYIAGGMYRGISSEQMVVKMAKAGMLGIFGSGGLGYKQVEQAIQKIQSQLSSNQLFGMNFLQRLDNEEKEVAIIDLFLKYHIKVIEASGFIKMTKSLVKYRAKGLKKDVLGNVVSEHKIIAKMSRPEVAEMFLSPAPDKLLDKLVEQGDITSEEALLAGKIPVADDITVEGDSGGHTDQGITCVLFPAMVATRDRLKKQFGYEKDVRIGLAGGIGTPISAVAAFAMGADYIVTGSINQCTVESNTSELVKSLLQDINVQDTDYTIAGDMFEIGAKVQVLKKGVFFPARGNTLYELYRHNNSIDDLDEDTKQMIEKRYFKKSFKEVYQEMIRNLSQEEIQKIEDSPKKKMALIFKWYFSNSTRLAMEGEAEGKIDFQVHCGPALGAFNQWVRGTELEDWRNRHVDQIAIKIMDEASEQLVERLKMLMN
ncbi:ACP S-malonyltransferase [Anaeromicropila populeti]|uniref:[acyl-carrier-protein] S-malonyltransferase n=1 Tax=Anaeromicropila populeti TaxID=37658 RepID=A0A1I6IZQ8_9FIRM|nr:ACP S-malonyltransferase [Anaeromicropila populeti]SFR72197.1 trans-AT polyketide synthase, acyltransferase and oxidoreductase domain-containing protein [Anaeromicropila populeti]